MDEPQEYVQLPKPPEGYRYRLVRVIVEPNIRRTALRNAQNDKLAVVSQHAGTYYRRYTDSELALIADTRLSVTEVAERLGRSWRAIRNKRKRLQGKM